MKSENFVYDRVCITLDIDWASDEIIQPVISLMEQAGVKATLFATHRSQCLEHLNADQIEVGLHPNFNESGGDFRGPIQKLKALYPKAKGARSHSLFVSSGIFELYMENGLEYEANMFLPLHEGLHPVKNYNDLVSIPCYWSDDAHLSFKDSFTLSDLRLEVPGLKVFNFHPIHIFMNTFSHGHYKSYKSYYQDPDELRRFVNSNGEGVGTLFRLLLDHIARSKVATYTLYEIYEEYVAEHDE